jgi:hypothetical protein
MKGIAVLTAAILIGLSPMIGNSFEKREPVPSIPVSLNGSDWQREEAGAWDGLTVDGAPAKFKMDRKKDGALSLYYSTDGFKWEPKNDQVWKDSDGNHFRVVFNSIVFSDDAGISWIELKPCVWQDPDDHWLMLDKEGRLWKMKAKQKEKEEVDVEVENK